jgi:hypothetical protein
LLKDQVELLTLVRDAGITSAQFRALLGLDDDGRQAVADAITPLQHGVNAILVAQAAIDAARTGTTAPIPAPEYAGLP